MTDAKLAQELVDTLARPDGSPDLRPVHALGIGATGHFVASDVARTYCNAAHFNGDTIPVTMRFSNGSGAKDRHDGWSDVRGMATRFHLANKTDTDLIAMTLPEFFAPTPEGFLAFAKAAQPVPVQWQSPWSKIWGMLKLIPPMPDPYPGEEISPNPGAIAFANENKSAQLAVFQAAAIGAPVSYERASYHAVHTFVVTGEDGVRREVRFAWEPVAGVKTTDPHKTPVDVYLNAKLRKTLHDRPARFSLMMAIGEVGDAFADSTKPWPPHRIRVSMGTLTIDSAAKDTPEQDEYFEKLSFNPGLLTPGIEMSADPVLHIREEAYKISSKKRGGTPCPFAKGNS